MFAFAASHARQLIRAASVSKRLALVVVSCCALGLAFIPAATAKRDSGGSSTAAGSEQASTQPASSGSETSATTDSSRESPAAPASRRHENSGREHQAAGASTTAAASAGAETTAATPPAHGDASRRDGGREKYTTRRSPRGGRSHSSADEAAPASAKGEKQDASPADAPSQAAAKSGHGGGSGHKNKHHKEGKEGKGGKEGKEGKGGKEGKEGKGSKGGREGKGSKGGKEGTGPGEGPNEAPKESKGGRPSAPVLSSGSPVAFAAAAAPTSVAARRASLPAAAGLSTPTRITHGAARRRHEGVTSGRLAPPVAALGAATLVPVHAPSAHPTPAGHRSHDPHGAPSGGPVAPLVTTITKIVDVVPTTVRALIAGLLALALALAVRSRLTAVRARRLERQRRELLDDVGLLQAALLPETPARLGPVATSAAYQPAAGPGAGGDFYDVFALPDGQLAVIVGDISGHGRQALPHTALVRFTLRAYLEAGLSPRDALQTAGAVLERQLTGVFATVVVAIYEPRERVLVYSCAGHPPPLVLGADAGAGSLAPVTIGASPPIGVGMRTGTRQTTVSLPGRARICFYTDGVTEARVGSELFGSERLEQTLAELGSEADASALLAQVAARADARPDDMAACLLSVEGGEDPPVVVVEELELDRTETGNARTASFLHACGVRGGVAAQAVRSASGAAGRAGTIVLEVRAGEHAPEVSLRREQLTRLHARPVEAGGQRAEASQ